MTDTIIKGSGNSRSVKTVPNALTLYPTHEAMMAAMVDGSFPIDLGPLNSAGCAQIGNDLNKETLLKDATAALYGLGAGAVPDNVLAEIRPLINTALGRAKFEVIQYNGTLNDSSTAQKTIHFSFAPNVVLIGSTPYRTEYGIFIRPANTGEVLITNQYIKTNKLTWSGNSLAISYSGTSAAVYVFNHHQETYRAVAIG